MEIRLNQRNNQLINYQNNH